jgi:hypothetical protein
MMPSFALFANRNCLGLRDLATIPTLGITAPLLFGLALGGLERPFGLLTLLIVPQRWRMT